MPVSFEGKLVVAISSRALFDFEDENRVFDAQGERAYIDLQFSRLDVPAPTGVAFALVKKLLAFNTPDTQRVEVVILSKNDPVSGLRVFDAQGERAYIDLQFSRLDVPAPTGVAFALVKKLLAFNTPDTQRVEVVILSKNDPVSGLRVFRSAERSGLKLERGVFTRGRSPYRYLDALKANLFLSANEHDVMSALEAHVPAARVVPESAQAAERHADEVRIAFDGDAVLFSDEAERVFQREGLEAFTTHETVHALRPLPPGPFKPLLEALHRLQLAAGTDVPMRVRTALVTARSAPAHERAVRTLMDWNIGVDEAMFLGGLDKGEFLRVFEPDFYFDDQRGHIESARRHVAAGHVPFGVTNVNRRTS